MTKIEQDAQRANIYNSIQNNLEMMQIHKANYDFLATQVNSWTEELKSLVEDVTVTEFTSEDYDTVVKLIIEKVEPLKEVKQFKLYSATVEEPIVEPVLETVLKEPIVEETNIIVTNE